MNPIFPNELMQARIADRHRKAERSRMAWAAPAESGPREWATAGAPCRVTWPPFSGRRVLTVLGTRSA